jgi:hypothetical protein
MKTLSAPLEATKARPGGAGERRGPSVALPPAQIYPARSKLTAKLAEYERALADLEDYKGRAERAAIDEDRAMADSQLTEKEAAERISHAQNERNVYQARQAQREKAMAAFLTELKTVLDAAHREFSNAVRVERTRVRDILAQRVASAGQLEDYSAVDLDELLDFSGPLRELRALEINSTSILFCDRPELISGMARKVLGAYEALELQRRKQV